LAKFDTAIERLPSLKSLKLDVLTVTASDMSKFNFVDDGDDDDAAIIDLSLIKPRRQIHKFDATLLLRSDQYLRILCTSSLDLIA
jgi:hypothetical protein